MTPQDALDAGNLAATVPQTRSGDARLSMLPIAASPNPGHQPATIVICAYTTSRLEIVKRAVSSACDQLHAGDEIVVVIDHNEQLLEAAQTAFADGTGPVLVIANTNRRGLSGARNTGTTAARGTLIVFLDDDAVPRPGWLAQLTEPFADPEVIGTGGLATPTWERERPDWLPEEFLWVVGCSYRGLPRHPAEIRNPIGANMAFRRSVIREAGGFTDGLGRVGRIPLGCEETEFSIRAARMTGGRIVQQPAAQVDHLVTADRASLGYFLRRCWAEGISKAFVSRLTGGEAATASERRYTTRTLPAGVAAGFWDGLTGDRSGLKRAAAILAGLMVTTAGYVRGFAVAPRPPGDGSA
jgi:GT2 family glycosyltransferase